MTGRGIEAVINEAAGAIPNDLAATTFAIAVDLMLADGRLTANEQQFTDELRGLLKVDGELAARIVDVLTIKNVG